MAYSSMLQRVAVWYSVLLQRVAVWCSVLLQCKGSLCLASHESCLEVKS